MMEAVGCTVTSLKRLSMGPFTLDPTLAEGEYRLFTEEEMGWANEKKASDTCILED